MEDTQNIISQIPSRAAQDQLRAPFVAVHLAVTPGSTLITSKQERALMHGTDTINRKRHGLIQSCILAKRHKMVGFVQQTERLEAQSSCFILSASRSECCSENFPSYSGA
jgi:hypothetical protein